MFGGNSYIVMGQIDETLEEAGRINADLETYTAMLQERSKDAVEHEVGSRPYRLRRGEIRREVENEIEEVYKEAKNLLDFADFLKIGGKDEERDEEVRLAREGSFVDDSHDYSGKVGKAMDSHMEKRKEVRNQDLLQHGTQIQQLRGTVHQYEELLYQINQNIEGLEFETPYTPRSEDSEIISAKPNFNPDEPEDLTKEFFSKKEI